MEADHVFDMRRLPHATRRIVRTLGIARARALLLARGGTMIRIPQGDDAVLADIIGTEGVQILRHEFGTEDNISLPMAEKVLLEQRNAGIRSAFQSGTSKQSLALEHGLSRRAIDYILADVSRGDSDPGSEPEKRENQGDLFAGWGS